MVLREMQSVKSKMYTVSIAFYTVKAPGVFRRELGNQNRKKRGCNGIYI